MALANLSTDAIKEGYEALKAGLKKKFGAQSDLCEAVGKLEQKPDSEARKAAVQEEVAAVSGNTDPEIVQLLENLLEKLRELPGGQQSIQQSQNNAMSGINVGGNFEFKPVQIGKQS
jgi:hypothetical protein